MGQVWLAQDSNLGREVALKTLPTEFAQDTERLSRLAREATLLAALNHPNIATIYGFEEIDGLRYLVMEHVDGITLAERISRGALPLDEALAIALQIAEALEAAHDQGIVHRDLKPANVMISKQGRVKVLDFGLAKPYASNALSDPDTPTLTHATVKGKVVGTPAYMSPEQVRGEAIDARTDIWAFGVILAEMLSGQTLFESRTPADTMARVIHSGSIEPELPAATPPLVARTIRRCLTRNPDLRLRHIGDAKADLRDSLDGGLSWLSQLPRATASRRTAIVQAASGVVAGTAIGWLSARLTSERRPTEHLEINTIGSLSGIPPFGVMAISPDSARIAYTIRNNSELVLYTTEIPDPGRRRESLGEGSYPFFSADSQTIAYFSLANDLISIDLNSRQSRPVVTDLTLPRGGSWGDDDTIVYSDGGALFRVAAAGNADPEPLVAPDRSQGERAFVWPDMLPGARAVVFTIEPVNAREGSSIGVLDLESLAYETRGAGNRANFLTSGHLLFLRPDDEVNPDYGDWRLVARSFDPRALVPTGPSRDLGYLLPAVYPCFDVSDDGTLIYAPALPSGTPPATVTVDRAGGETLVNPEHAFDAMRLAPDGTRLMGQDQPRTSTSANRDIWLLDLRRGGIATNLSNHEANDMGPVWGVAGDERYFFGSDRGRPGIRSIFTAPTTGPGDATPFYSDPEGANLVPTALYPDGSRLLTWRAAGQNESFVSINVEDPDDVETLIDPPSNVRNAFVSPSGKWITYQSNESGQFEIYLHRIGNPASREPVTGSSGGIQPAWSPNGDTIYYLSLADQPRYMMSVEMIADEPDLELGVPRRLFELDREYILRGGLRGFDVTADEQFVFRKQSLQASVPNRIMVVKHLLNRLD